MTHVFAHVCHCNVLSCWLLVVVEAFPAAEGVCGLSGPVPDPTDQQAEGVEVGAAQGRHRTSL